MKTEHRFRLSRRNRDCRDPSLWHSLNGTSTEIEVSELVAGFVVGLQPELVVETGSYRGQTSQMIGEALQRNGHGQLVTIESDRRFARRTKECCNGLPVEVVHGKTTNWTPASNTPIDFAFLDSNFESRLLEFDHLYEYMNSMTVVCWHDSGTQHPVREHVIELAHQGKISQPLFLPTPRGVCFARAVKC